MTTQLYLTAEHAGIGGQIKSSPEDFFVEEIPLYQPSGQGQHTYAIIEKTGLSTGRAVRLIADALGVSPKTIGYAGMKDAHAVTRQTISIDLVPPEAVAALSLPGINIIDATRHGNKLKTGHLSGNRFVIRIRGVEQGALPQAQTILDQLTTWGVPNFYDSQRFGNRNNSHILGQMLVQQDSAGFINEYLGQPQPQESQQLQTARSLVDAQQWEQALSVWPGHLSDERRVLAALASADGRPEVALKTLNKKAKLFFVSAFQSHLFNQLLAERLDGLHQLENGDVAYIHHKGAAFIVEDADQEQPRADSFEISPSGPMFGYKTLMATGEPGKREWSILAQYGLTLDSFKLPGLKISGARRPYRFQVKNSAIHWDEGIVVSFELPAGAYATRVMAEIMKP